ncbi:helix-turn-helix domain-containing protein [uncultured Jatrophihabitans sp.]|uniref:helix-turn-helix domain-containing protein n=1 Tax=uncultured Jatrophihabitans sp. TaxID=1610747 RepID=UPI0035C9FB5F
MQPAAEEPEWPGGVVGTVPRVSAATWSLACRKARTLSQRELAELAGLSRSTVDRLESERGRAAFDTVVTVLAATGYALVAVDSHGRPLRVRGASDGPFDRAGRRLPVHLHPHRTLGYRESPTYDRWTWWGWHCIAWWDGQDTVPDWTFRKRRRELPRLGKRHERDSGLDLGRVWDDAT